MTHEHEAVYTVKEVARKLRLSQSTVRNMVRDGRLPRVKDLQVDRVLIPAWAVDQRIAPPDTLKKNGTEGGE